MLPSPLNYGWNLVLKKSFEGVGVFFILGEGGGGGGGGSPYGGLPKKVVKGGDSTLKT